MIVWLKGLVMLIFMVAAGAVMADEKQSLGASLYKTYCWQCHGRQGDGQGINVRDMSVQPRNHRDAKEMSSRSDAELFKAIKEGGQSISKSVLMPPWGGNLSDAEINALVGYLRELCQCQHGS